MLTLRPRATQGSWKSSIFWGGSRCPGAQRTALDLLHRPPRGGPPSSPGARHHCRGSLHHWCTTRETDRNGLLLLGSDSPEAAALAKSAVSPSKHSGPRRARTTVRALSKRCRSTHLSTPKHKLRIVDELQRARARWRARRCVNDTPANLDQGSGLDGVPVSRLSPVENEAQLLRFLSRGTSRSTAS